MITLLSWLFSVLLILIVLPVLVLFVQVLMAYLPARKPASCKKLPSRSATPMGLRTLRERSAQATLYASRATLCSYTAVGPSRSTDS